MSWIYESDFKWYQKFLIKILRVGPVPNHIAVIMDGNRRYAINQKIKTAEGHSKGFDKLTETLQWCHAMGVKELTVYAFSIENFNRKADEVNTLMDLAREKFKRLLDERDKLNAAGVCVRVIGNLSLIPKDIRKMICETVLSTKDNSSGFLNIAFAYTSRDEIVDSLQTISKAIKSQIINESDITSDLVTNCMYSNKSLPPDIIIRTSGEVRFSDFMLWQIANTTVFFTEVLWPSFNLNDFLFAIFQYQRFVNDMDKTKKQLKFDKSKEGNQLQNVINRIELERIKKLKYYCSME